MANVFLATDNRMGIPVLKPESAGDFVDSPCIPWGSRNRSNRMYGTYHFYVDDYRFEKVWDDPDKVVKSHCVSVVEPNFTNAVETPKALAIYNTYRKRWLARYWQAAGIRVFVDLNVHPKWRKLNLVGVPKGWRAYATRGYADRVHELDNELALARKHAGTEIHFWVYGGGKVVKAWCLEHEILHLEEDTTVRVKASRTKKQNAPENAEPRQLRLVN